MLDGDCDDPRSTEAIVKVRDGDCDVQMHRGGAGAAVKVDPNVATEVRQIAGALLCIWGELVDARSDFGSGETHSWPRFHWIRPLTDTAIYTACISSSLSLAS